MMHVYKAFHENTMPDVFKSGMPNKKSYSYQIINDINLVVFLISWVTI